MGFDNECILNIQSLAGEYFCPVCRLLVYPNEAIQSQCTHLYCKPCLTYVVSTTKACPYDGYLVTEEHSKPLIESNKTLAETIGKIAVHCLYHRSGCTWQGQLSECITHCAGCAFGNSPVVCNRCGTQIVHRQVQEHAQNCPGVQPQAQQVEGGQDATTAANATAATAEQSQAAAAQAGGTVSQAQVAQTAVGASSGQEQSQVSTTLQPQAAAQVAPTPEQQWYQQQQQQYQQYYQQYPGYDPYQQQYQQYGAYPQQAYQQYPQQPQQAIPGQQPQMYMQPQPQVPVRPQAQPQPQAASHAQAQVAAQPQVQGQTQVAAVQPQVQGQTQVAVQPQLQGQVNMPNQVQSSHPQVQQQGYPQQPQSYPQAQAYQQPYPPQPQVQPHLQQRPQVPQQQQQQPIPYPPQPHQQTYPYPQAQLPAQTQVHPQSQAQIAQMQPQARPQSQPQHPAHAVTGHQSYPQPQPNQQLPAVASQGQSVYVHPQQQPQPTVPMQAQFPQQHAGPMRPPASQVPMHQQQQAAMLPPQGQHQNLPPPPQTGIPQGYQANQPVHQYPGMHPHQQKGVSQQLPHGHSLHPQSLPGQTPGLVQNTSHQAAPYIQTQAAHPQLRPQAPASVLPSQQQVQQNVQNYSGQSMLPNHGAPHQTFQPTPVGPGGPAHAKATQLGGVQSYPQRSNLRPAEQQRGYVNQAMPPQSVNETSQYPSSAAPLYGMKTDANEANVSAATPSQGTHLVESRLGKTETDLKAVFERKSTDGDKEEDAKHILAPSQNLEKDPASSQNGLDDSVVKNMTKEEGIGKPESSSGATSSETAVQNLEGHSQKQDDNSQLEDKEIDDARKNVTSQEAELPNGKDVRMPNDTVVSQEMVTSQEKVNEAHSLIDRNILQSQNSRQQVQDSQQLIMNYGNVDARGLPRPDQNPLQTIHPHQMQIPGPPPTHLRPQGHPSNVPAHLQQSFAKQPFGSIPPEVLPSGILGPGSSALTGRGPSSFGQMLPHQLGNPRMQGDPMGRPPFGGAPPGPYDSQGITGRIPPHDRPTNPMDSEFLVNKRTDYFDGRQFDPHMRGSADAPFGHPPNMQSDYMKFNGGPTRGVSSGLSDPAYPLGLQDERFKNFPEERYRQFPEEGSNLSRGERFGNFPAESGRHIINHREFLDDLKHFPRPTHLDEHVPKPESYFSSRPYDRAPHGFPGEARLKLDGGASSAASRLLPPYQPGDLRPISIRDDIAGRKGDPLHPEFSRQSLESGRIRTDGLPPLRSPGRDYSDIPSNRFGRIEDNDGRDSRAFGERSKLYNANSDTNPFLERRFPSLPSHLLRGELDAPGRIGDRVHLRGGELVGPEMLHGGGPLGPRNLHMGEPGGYGTHRLGDLSGPGNLPLNRRIGDAIGGNLPSHSRPGFSSGMHIHPFSSDAGLFNAGEVDALDNSRKRKHGSTGWCRLCKVDCETVEGLEMHSQTREHQKMAMDMVLNIKKDNAKKQKVPSDDHISHDGDTNNARKTDIENHAN